MGVVGMFVSIVGLACLCLVTANPTDPSGVYEKRLHHVYKYSAVVSVGQKEPKSFASKFLLEGNIIQIPNYTNGSEKYLKLNDLKHTVYNGPNDEEKIPREYKNLGNDVKQLEEGFVGVYKKYGRLANYEVDHERLIGVKIPNVKESSWSKNMKIALGSLMVDYNDIKGVESRTMMGKENTIHGECHVVYDFYNDRKEDDGRRFHYLRKTYDPRNCSNYVQHVATSDNNVKCQVEPEEELLTTVEKLYKFEIAKDTQKLLLKKISAHEKLIYLPWSYRSSGIQYIETNLTIEYETTKDGTVASSTTDFTNVPKINVTYDKTDDLPTIYSSKDTYCTNDSIDRKTLIANVKEHLLSITQYLKENHIDINVTNPEHGHAFEKLHQTLTCLDTDTMHYIYKHFNTETEKGNLTRTMFLQMLPHTGTYAAWNFTKDLIISDQAPSESIILDILEKLPMYVENPTEEFAEDMIDFKLFGTRKLSKAISNAGIFCYSILLHKTYKNIGRRSVPPFLEQQLQHFYDRLQHEPTYQSKIIYIMAMRNVEVGNIDQYLVPLIEQTKGFFVNVDIKKSEKYRIAAMWAVGKSISHNKDYTHSLFWKILSNSSEPLSVRTVAYELLVPRNPNVDIQLLMKIHSLMTDEENDHLYNYHYKTIKNMAKLKDPCMMITSEMMRKMLRITKPRKSTTSKVLISDIQVNDYFDKKYAHGRTYKIGAQYFESSNVPQTGYSEEISNFGLRPMLERGIYWNIDGVNLHTITRLLVTFLKPSAHSTSYQDNVVEITDESIKSILRQTNGYKLLDKHMHIEFWIMNRGYVTNVEVVFESNLLEFVNKYFGNYGTKDLQDAEDKLNINWIGVSFANNYKMTVPTELGIPAKFNNRIPQVTYVKFQPKIYQDMATITMKLEFELKFHQLSTYWMEVYNPLADLIHSVRRIVTTDVALPIDVKFNLNLHSQNLNVVLPRTADTRFSVAGIKIRSVDRVNVDADFKDQLKVYCPECQHQVDVTNGPMYAFNRDNVYDSLDTGLEYRASVFDCDTEGITDVVSEEWFRILKDIVNENPYTMISVSIQQGLVNLMNVPYATNCGIMVKLSPSVVHPTSYLKMSWTLDLKKIDESIKMIVLGSMDTKSAISNRTNCHWYVYVHSDFSQFVNDFRMLVTRKAYSDKASKQFGLEIKKVYPDISKNIEGNYKTNTEVNITYKTGLAGNVGNTPQKNAVVSIKMTGEPLDQQLELLKRNYESGDSCFKNVANPLDVDVTKRLDWNCLDVAIEATTIRKYTFDIVHHRLPHEVYMYLTIIGNYLHDLNLANVSRYRPEHTESGNVKMVVTFDPNTNYGNVTIVDPYFTTEYIEQLYGLDDQTNGDIDVILDNTGFSHFFLASYYVKDKRPCIVHANDVITHSNQTVPMNFNEWTLVTGDYELMSFAMFVKQIENNKLSILIAFEEHKLIINPGPKKPIVILDDDVIPNYEEMFRTSESFCKMKFVNEFLLLEFRNSVQIRIYYTAHNVIVLPVSNFGNIYDGVCGNAASKSTVQQIPLQLHA